MSEYEALGTDDITALIYTRPNTFWRCYVRETKEMFRSRPNLESNYHISSFHDLPFKVAICTVVLSFSNSRGPKVVRGSK